MAYNEGCKAYAPQLMLKSFPIRVFAHGFVNYNGVKASKSKNAITPMELVDEYGSDAYRYYFLSKFNYDTDGNYSFEHFKEVYNADLANSLGNLVSRTVGMTLQHFDGKIPAINIEADPHIWLNEDHLKDYESFIVEACSFRHALELTWKVVFAANKYVEVTKPWELVKVSPDATVCVLRTLIGSLRIISLLLRPFLPKVAEKIYNAFEWQESWDEVDWKFLQDLSKNNFIGLENGIAVNRDFLDNDKCPVLFPRVK